MNEHTEFEKLVKDKFANSFEQPDDLLWKRLNDQLQHNDEKERRRKFIIWSLSSLSVLVVLLGTVLYGLNNSDAQNYFTNKDPHQHSSIELSKTKISKDQRENNGFKEDRGSYSQNDPNQNKKERSFNSKKKDVKALASNDSKYLGMKRGNYSDNLNKDFTSTHTEQYKEGHKIEDNNFQETTPLNKEDLPLDIASNIEKTTYPLTIHPVDETEQNENVVTVDIDEHGTTEPVHSEDKESETAVNGTSEKTEIGNVPPLEVLNNGNYVSKKWFIGVQLIPSYSSRHLTSNTANSSKVDFYNSHEDGRVTMSLGLLGGLALNKNIAIRSGLSYNSYSSTFSVSNMSLAFDTLENNLNIETEYGDYDIEQDEFNDDSEGEDPEEEELNEEDSTTLNLSFSNTQTLNFIQLPIYCEFGFDRNKWKWSIGTGLLYSYLANAKTEFTTTGFAPIKRNNTSQFTRNSLSGSFNIGVEYALSTQFSVKAAPQFTYMFTPISSTNQLTIKPFWVGLDLSIKYYLK